MKLWRFFKKPDTPEDEIPDTIHITDKYPLYALTCEKKLAKRFMSERNMDKFIMKKSEVEPDEYADYANTHRSSVLEICELITSDINKDDDDSEWKQHVDISMLMTMAEKQICEEPSQEIFNEVWWIQSAPNPMLFTKELCDALRSLDYISCYKLYTSLSFYDTEDDDYSAPDWYVDELAVFINTFGRLLK